MSKFPGFLKKGRVTQMRYLDLTEQRYEILYNGLVNFGGLEAKQIRLLDKILRKIEVFGVLKDDGSYALSSFIARPIILTLEDSEFALTQLCVNNMKWSTKYTKEAVAFLDWFEDIPTKPFLKVSDDVADPAPKIEG